MGMGNGTRAPYMLPTTFDPYLFRRAVERGSQPNACPWRGIVTILAPQAPHTDRGLPHAPSLAMLGHSPHPLHLPNTLFDATGALPALEVNELPSKGLQRHLHQRAARPQDSPRAQKLGEGQGFETTERYWYGKVTGIVGGTGMVEMLWWVALHGG